MARLKDLTFGASVTGILSSEPVVKIDWHDTNCIELTYKDLAGKLGSQLLFRDDEERLDHTSSYEVVDICGRDRWPTEAGLTCRP